MTDSGATDTGKSFRSPSPGPGNGNPHGISLALATPPGVGGIAEVHVWGAGCAMLVDGIFRSKSGLTLAEAPPGRILYGWIVDNGVTLDEVIALRKETERICDAETVEIGCHGGGAAARAVMDALSGLGAVETTWDQALDAACARGETSHIETEANKALRDCLSPTALPVLLFELDAHPLEREIARTLTLVETDGPKAELALRTLLNQTWPVPFVEPQAVFIAGFPNAGKSSLFNALAGRKKVIVHDTPGTTRDYVDEVVALDELPVRLFDSAGLGESATDIEKLAEEFAFRAMKEARIVLFVFDGSRPVKEGEMTLYNQLDCATLIPIINKTDLPRAEGAAGVPGAIGVSALTGEGLEQVREAVAGHLVCMPAAVSEAVVFTARQEGLLWKALHALEAGDMDGAAGALTEALGSAWRRNQKAT